MLIYILVYFVIINVYVFLEYGIDKYLAKNNMYRISEKTLLLSALIGGSVGAIGGSYFFHHKTKKLKFKIINVLSCIIHIVIMIFLIRS